MCDGYTCGTTEFNKLPYGGKYKSSRRNNKKTKLKNKSNKKLLSK